jgi:hypothetical protein
MDKSSLKSSNIRDRILHLVNRKGNLGNRAHALVRGQGLPVQIFLGLEVVEAPVDSDNLVHMMVCTMKQPLSQRTKRRNGESRRDLEHRPVVVRSTLPSGSVEGAALRDQAGWRFAVSAAFEAVEEAF